MPAAAQKETITIADAVCLLHTIPGEFSQIYERLKNESDDNCSSWIYEC